jgi:DNA-binding MarR family transcriptional regulator
LTIYSNPRSKVLSDPSYGYELSILLLLASRTVIDELQSRLNQAGYGDIRPAYGFVFQLISVRDGASVNEVAEHLGVTKQAASQTVEFLERRGYVVRQANPKDGRGKLVRLTHQGWECIREVENILSNIEQQSVQLFGLESQTQLRQDLRRLILELNGGVLPQQLRPVW